jgi:hypothetical protein
MTGNSIALTNTLKAPSARLKVLHAVSDDESALSA